MENTLKQLFDYQKFEQNPRLQKLIDAAHSGARKLDLDEAEMVSAAGAKYEHGNEDNLKEP